MTLLLRRISSSSSINPRSAACLLVASLRGTEVPLTSLLRGRWRLAYFSSLEGGGVTKREYLGYHRVVCHDGSCDGPRSQLEARVRKKSLATVAARKRIFYILQLSKSCENRALNLDCSGRWRALVASPTGTMKTGSSGASLQVPSSDIAALVEPGGGGGCNGWS